LTASADFRQTSRLNAVDRPASQLDGPQLGSRLGFALAVLVPLGSYLWTLGGTTYWLDAGEFNAAAVVLGVPHPPGHPLTPLLGKLLSLLPLGSLGVRIVFGQALCAAFGAGFLYAAVRRSLVLAGRDEGASAVALAAAWLLALSPGYWLQAVRSEVYALQALLLCVAIERATACADRPDRPRAAGTGSALASACLALGLGLANNHLMAVVALPALAPALWGALSARGLHGLAAPLGAGLLGLCAYVYLPLRSLAAPAIDLGSPHSLARFVWVVSARVYTREMGQGGSEPLADRFIDALLLMHENLHWGLLLAALGGAYLWLRGAHTRQLGLVLVLWGAGAFLARPFVGPVRGNPDVLGYLIPAFAACAWAAGAFVHVMLSELSERVPLRPLRAAAWLALPLLALAQWPRAAARADLSRFDATAAFDEARHRSLPPRALLVTSFPQSVFRAWELEVVERARPDLALLPLPFLRYPGAVDALQRRGPELAELGRGYLRSGRLELAQLDRLAQRRPLLVELDLGLPGYLAAQLTPEGALHRWQPRGATPVPEARLRLAIVQRRFRLAMLRQRVAGDLQDQETARQLLGIHYADAVYYALRGQRGDALDSIASARTLYPDDALLLGFRAALEQSDAARPFDVRPYLIAPP
jgi:hypothetical protein